MNENQIPVIELTDEDGNKEMFQELKRVDYKGHTYAFFCPQEIDDNEPEVGLVIMECLDDHTMQMLEDESLCEAVFEVFAEEMNAEAED